MAVVAPVLGWSAQNRLRERVIVSRVVVAVSGLGLALLALVGVLMALELAVHVLSSRSLNSSTTLPLPAWIDDVTERPEVAFPIHVAFGTALETFDLSPPATAVQWFKAAAHARTDQHVEQAAQGIAGALARDEQQHMIPLLCTLREIGNARQVQAANQSGLSCDGWTPSIALVATPSTTEAVVGSHVQIVAVFQSMNGHSGLVDVEVHDRDGTRLAQWVFPDQTLAANEPRTYTVEWAVPADLPPGEYDIKLGVFEAGWRSLHAWKNAAATVTVTAE